VLRPQPLFNFKTGGLLNVINGRELPPEKKKTHPGFEVCLAVRSVQSTVTQTLSSEMISAKAHNLCVLLCEGAAALVHLKLVRPGVEPG
jgi:hypothetical protein